MNDYTCLCYGRQVELFREELSEVACFKEKTVKLYVSIACDYADYAEKTMNINPVESTTGHINEWFSHLREKGKTNHFLKDCRASLGHFFSLLVKSGCLKENPAEFLAPVRIPKSELNKPISKQSAFALLHSFDRCTQMGMRNFTIVSFLYALGLRVNELLEIKTDDVRLDYDPRHRIGTLLVHGKGGKERTLFIVDGLYDTVVAYCGRKKAKKRTNSPFFPGRDAKNMRGDRVRQLINEAAATAGITERVTPHVLRHTFATEMYNRNVPIEAIKEMMGHASVRETSIYIHVSDELEAAVLEKISIREDAS
jgi:site-specific recombinase XerD